MTTKNFQEYLENEIERARASYERCRERVTDDVKRMEPYIAGDYGAAYASRIEEMTMAAERYRVTREIASAYSYYLDNNGIDLRG